MSCAGQLLRRIERGKIATDSRIRSIMSKSRMFGGARLGRWAPSAARRR